MDGKRVSGPAGRDRGGRHRKKKAAPGLRVIERDGCWHIVGTLRAGGRSIRLRKSTGLPATSETREAAEKLKTDAESAVRTEAVFGVKPSVPFAVAADQYLNRPRTRPLNGVDVQRIQELTRHFGVRILNTIGENDWHAFVDRRCAKVAPPTRERYLSLLFGFLSWCAERPRCWLTELPYFKRDRAAKKKRAVRRRRVVELTPELVALLIEHASPHLAAQLAVEWSTGARVSSVLFGCRLCDLNLASGRETITFQKTKTGEPVIASLNPWAADVIRRYIEWRGGLHDREAPLFLTHRRVPYSDNPKVSGGQNKTAFVAAKRRAIKALRWQAASAAWAMRAAGQREQALDAIGRAKSQAELLTQITQHWFLHALATNLFALGADVKSVMDQGGWLDPHSALIYAHSVPDRRRALIAALPTVDTSLTHEKDHGQKKA